ncbi:MAG: galactose mutarotase [Clostridiales bacterium]|nr:galactose mutarotase [Clostridiales bacterium]
MKNFGMSGGAQAKLYTLSSEGMSVCFTDLGCSLTSLLVPDRFGCMRDVALGYGSAAGYMAGSSFVGATVGRYAGRIGGARFSLGERSFELEKNDGENHLHGGFGKRLFAAEEIRGGVKFSLVSPDMDEGFPGRLELSVSVTLKGRALRLVYEAVSDADTFINITNHSYFNLNGRGDIAGHVLRVNAKRYAELGPGNIPTGELLSVRGTPFDFTSRRPLMEAIADPALASTRGLDHSFALENEGRLVKACELISPDSGIRLSCRTTQPSVHIYTAGFLDGDRAPFDKNGHGFERHGGVCLETQHFPDSPNKKEFPSTLLKAGETYREITEFEFDIVK